MLNPAGAVIQAIIAIYNTDQLLYLNKIKQIGAVVASFIDSISAIAAGKIKPAAKKVEQTMANTLTLIIAFMAKFVGLGNVPNKIVGIINKFRKPIDKGLDKIVAWLGRILKKIKGAVKGGKDNRTPKEKERDIELAQKEAEALISKKGVKLSQVRSGLPKIKKKYNLSKIELESQGKLIII